MVERVFDSPEKMAATAGRLSAATDSVWTGRMRCLQVDGLRADYVELDPYQLEVPPLEERPADLQPHSQLMLSIMLSGTSSGTVDGHQLTLSSSQAAIIDGRAAMHFRSEVPVRALRLFVDENEIPAEALMCSELPYVRLKHTPLVTGCIGLITGLLQVSSPVVEPHDEVAVARPLIALMTSLLAEALRDGRSAPRPDDADEMPLRRQRIEAYIDQHLTESDLAVSSIGAALGLHIRTVYGVYEGTGQTVMGLIRARRLARAQALLALREDPPNTSTLAGRVGLSSKQLTRAFQQHTGHTARQWWELNRRNAAATTVDRDRDADSRET